MSHALCKLVVESVEHKRGKWRRVLREKAVAYSILEVGRSAGFVERDDHPCATAN